MKHVFKAAVAAAVLVAALEALLRIAEQQRPRRQKRTAARPATNERAGPHHRYAIAGVPLLERGIARAIRAQHVLYGPAIAGRQHLRAQAGGRTELLSLVAGVAQ